MQDNAIKPQALGRRHRVADDIRSVIKSLGLVFGDIGTSPIYTLTVIFLLLKPTVDNVMGVLSLAVWTLVILVSVEYAWLAMSLGEKGEGGITPVVAQKSAGLWISAETLDRIEFVQGKKFEARNAQLLEVPDHFRHAAIGPRMRDPGTRILG